MARGIRTVVRILFMEPDLPNLVSAGRGRDTLGKLCHDLNPNPRALSTLNMNFRLREGREGKID